jgi:hypothetical protein
MSYQDDRQAFEANKINQSLVLGRNEEAFQQSLQLVTALDSYDDSYLWSWMGVPIIQMPADVLATQPEGVDALAAVAGPHR